MKVPPDVSSSSSPTTDQRPPHSRVRGMSFVVRISGVPHPVSLSLCFPAVLHNGMVPIVPESPSFPVRVSLQGDDKHSYFLLTVPNCRGRVVLPQDCLALASLFCCRSVPYCINILLGCQPARVFFFLEVLSANRFPFRCPPS